MNSVNSPILLKLISSLVKSSVGAEEANVNSMGEFLVVEPLVTVVDAMVIIGELLSKVKVNVAASILLFTALSVNLFTSTVIIYLP